VHYFLFGADSGLSALLSDVCVCSRVCVKLWILHLHPSINRHIIRVCVSMLPCWPSRSNWLVLQFHPEIDIFKIKLNCKRLTRCGKAYTAYKVTKVQGHQAPKCIGPGPSLTFWPDGGARPGLGLGFLRWDLFGSVQSPTRTVKCAVIPSTTTTFGWCGLLGH
jgi:hypothetical protein